MSFTPSYNKSFVLTGQAALYLAPFVADVPAVAPATTVALGTAWGAPWVPAGATLDGIKVGFDRKVNDIVIEEQVTRVDEKTTSADFHVTTTLSEDTLDTMRYAYGGGTITTAAPTTLLPGTKTLVISSDSMHFALGIEGQAPPRSPATTSAPWRRIVVPEITSSAKVETDYRRADKQRVYTCTFTSLVPPESVSIVEYNADHTV